MTWVCTFKWSLHGGSPNFWRFPVRNWNFDYIDGTVLFVHFRGALWRYRLCDPSSRASYNSRTVDGDSPRRRLCMRKRANFRENSGSKDLNSRFMKNATLAIFFSSSLRVFHRGWSSPYVAFVCEIPMIKQSLWTIQSRIVNDATFNSRGCHEL